MRLKLLLNGALLSTVPWPIYLDLATRTLIWREPTESFHPLPPGTTPVTVGSIAFVIFCILNFAPIKEISVRSQKFRLSPTILGTLALSLLALLVLNALGQGSTLRFVQLYIVIFAVFFIRLPVQDRDIRVLRTMVFVSFTVFLALHLGSYFSSDYFGIDPYYTFATFLDGSIHGSLVSYPPVLLLYGVIILILSARSRHPVLLMCLGLIITLFALVSDRREAMLQVMILSVGFLGYLFAEALAGGYSKRLWLRLLRVAVVVYPAIAILIAYGPVTSFERLVRPSERLDPRVEIWQSMIPTDAAALLFGNLQASNYGHSLLISVLFSFGLLGLLPFAVATAGVLTFVKVTASEVRLPSRSGTRKLPEMQRLILFAFAVNLISSNLFNTNITQTYYVTNLITLFLVVRTVR